MIASSSIRSAWPGSFCGVAGAAPCAGRPLRLEGTPAEDAPGAEPVAQGVDHRVILGDRKRADIVTKIFQHFPQQQPDHGIIFDDLVAAVCTLAVWFLLSRLLPGQWLAP